MRIEPGASQSAADYLDVVAARRRLIARSAALLADIDAFVLPTVAIEPPTIESFADGDPDYYSTTNLLCLRNTSVGNFLDGCAISIPVDGRGPDRRPIGVMLMAGNGDDRALLSTARTVEALLTVT